MSRDFRDMGCIWLASLSSAERIQRVSDAPKYLNNRNSVASLAASGNPPEVRHPARQPQILCQVTKSDEFLSTRYKQTK